MGSLKSLYEARDTLLADGFLPEKLERLVRPAVLQSWHRSIVSGAQPNMPALVFNGNPSPHNGLRAAADPILSRLAERLSGLDAGVLLADQDANIVRRWVAESSFRPLLDRINSNVGFNVSEETIGTSGVGTVIEAGMAVQISGPEHLAEALSPFTCVGVPIHHPITQRLEGVITLSCRATATNPLLTPLMTSTAQDIEHRMLSQTSARERLLLDAYMVATGSRRAPIAAVGQNLFIAGPRVTELLEGIDQALLWEYVRMVALGSRVDGSEYGFSPEKFRVTRCQPIESDGIVIGAIVEFEAERRETPDDSCPLSPLKPTVALPGKSSVLAQTISHATRLAAKGVSILIEGESGVGKLALARAVLESTDVSNEDISTIDAAATGVEGPAHFVHALRQTLDLHPKALLLRHLESLTPEAAAAAASVLEEFTSDDWSPRIVGTLTISPTDPLARRLPQRLVDTIGVGRVLLPPLRERREDIAQAAVSLLNTHRGDKPLTFSSTALRSLMRAPWPGNLRQLDSMIRGLISTTVGAEIRPDDLPMDLQTHSRKRDLSAIEELELSAILDALRLHHGNKVAAAQSIGISRSTLYRKLQAYHIDPDRQYY